MVSGTDTRASPRILPVALRRSRTPRPAPRAPRPARALWAACFVWVFMAESKWVSSRFRILLRATFSSLAFNPFPGLLLVHTDIRQLNKSVSALRSVSSQEAGRLEVTFSKAFLCSLHLLPSARVFHESKSHFCRKGDGFSTFQIHYFTYGLVPSLGGIWVGLPVEFQIVCSFTHSCNKYLLCSIN